MAAVTAAVVGIASAGVGAVQGFSAASRAKRDAADASEAASKAMKAAKAKAETDFYEGLAVPLDSYEAEFENNLAVAQQSTEALQEGDARALASGVGRVGATAADQAEQTRIAMGKDISELDQMKATSKDAINQQLMEMDVAEAKQQNQIAAESKAAQAAGISQGIQGIGGVVSGIGSMAKLYPGGGKTAGATTPAAGASGGGGQFSQQAAQSQLSTGAGGLMGGNKSAFGSGGGPSLGVKNPFEGLGGFTPSAMSPNYFK
tara:strand:- start:22092 stop:22874 length:783 start_codon:yes stop_codon:yes gene_type:complete